MAPRLVAVISEAYRKPVAPNKNNAKPAFLLIIIVYLGWWSEQRKKLMLR